MPPLNSFGSNGPDGLPHPPPPEAEAEVSVEVSIHQFCLHAAVRSSTSAQIRGVIDFLVELGVEELLVATEQPSGVTPLHLAAALGKTEAVQMLLAVVPRAAGLADSTGGTPLYAAAHYGEAGVIRLLLANEPAGNRENSFKVTPLHTAAIRGHAEAVRALLAPEPLTLAAAAPAGAGGCTPLHLAAYKGGGGVARALLERMPPGGVDLADDGGAAPLHVAAEKGHGGVIRLLLAAGASRSLRNAKGFKPFHLAVGYGHAAAASVFLSELSPQDAKAEVAELMGVPGIPARLAGLPEMCRELSKYSSG